MFLYSYPRFNTTILSKRFILMGVMRNAFANIELGN
jgi:hypothetical protein